MLIGALEAGGTKMVCAVGREDGSILEQVSIPTTTPEETVAGIVNYFKGKEIEALGVAAFGPVDVKPQSPTYGQILDTPKLAWRHFDLLGALKKELDVPMGLDTDVNGSCLGELTYGCAKGLDSVIYITIGTGVGVGVSVGGALGQEGRRAGGPPGGVGTGELLHRSGAGQLHHDSVPAEDYSGRRRHAPGAALPVDPQKGDGDDRRLPKHEGAGGYGQLYCARKPARRSGNHGLHQAGA